MFCRYFTLSVRWRRTVWPRRLTESEKKIPTLLLPLGGFSGSHSFMKPLIRLETSRERTRFWLQADLVICGLFICEFPYIRLRIILFHRTYPLFYGHPWSYYMQIRYMQAIFYGPYLSHITRYACINELVQKLSKNTASALF